MTAQSPTGTLEAALARLHESVTLVRTSVEDCPDDPDHRPDHKALTDLRDAVDDLLDAVDEARWAARSGHASLPAVHRGVLRAEAVLQGDLLRLDQRFDTARRAARAWGGAWRPWSDVVLTNLLEADDALREAERAVAGAWAAALASSRPTHPPAQDLEGSP